MNKSLLLASLVAAVALAACGKKEEMAAPAAAPATPLVAPVAAAASAAVTEAASAAAAATTRLSVAPLRLLPMPLRPPPRTPLARPSEPPRTPPPRPPTPSRSNRSSDLLLHKAAFGRLFPGRRYSTRRSSRSRWSPSATCSVGSRTQIHRARAAQAPRARVQARCCAGSGGRPRHAAGRRGDRRRAAPSIVHWRGGRARRRCAASATPGRDPARASRGRDCIRAAARRSLAAPMPPRRSGSPRSVTMPSRAWPARQTSCKGSAASCGTANGSSSSAPIVMAAPSRAMCAAHGAITCARHRRRPGARARPHRRAVAAVQGEHAAEMVAVFVGDENGVEVGRACSRAAANAAVKRRSVKPQSTSNRVGRSSSLPRASTSVALPLLPLARLVKRSTASARPRATSGHRPASATMRCPTSLASGAALRVLHGDVGLVAFALDGDAVTHRRAAAVGLAEAEQLAEETWFGCVAAFFGST